MPKIILKYNVLTRTKKQRKKYRRLNRSLDGYKPKTLRQVARAI